MARKLSAISPDWWADTTLDDLVRDARPVKVRRMNACVFALLSRRCIFSVGAV